jgi:hypothetical protein
MLDDALERGAVLEAFREDGELISTQTRHHIFMTHDIGEEIRQLDEHAIPLRMAVGIIHALEVIYVYEEEGERSLLIAQCGLYAIQGSRAVVEPCQPVLLCSPPELGFA